MGRPFVGRSGQLLNKVLEHVKVLRGDCLVTNVFGYRPPSNDVKVFFVGKGVAKKNGWASECPFPINGTTGFVSPDFVEEVERLKAELEEASPPVVIALGATALWSLTGQSKIGAFRGSVMESTLVPGLKVIPTFHPAAIMRQWQNLPLMISDFQKALEFLPDLEGTRTVDEPREIWVEPSLSDLDTFYTQYIEPLLTSRTHCASGASVEGDGIGFDIETTPRAGGQITCIGFAPNQHISICVPFWREGTGGPNYWSTTDEEIAAWQWCAKIICDPRLKKVAHNGPYDIQWLQEKLLMPLKGEVEDTMFMAHSLQPEMRKGLGVLVSLYLPVSAWKQMASFKTAKPDA